MNVEEIAKKKAEAIKRMNAMSSRINNESVKKTGKPGVLSASEAIDRLQTKFVSTGIMSLDAKLGGGFPKRHVTVIWGPPGTGKTCLLATACAGLNAVGEPALWAEMEPLTPMFWTLGVDPELTRIIKTEDYAELVIDKIESALYDARKKSPTGEVPLLVIDSINNFVGKMEVDKLNSKEGSAGQNFAVPAKIMTELIRRLTGRGYLDMGDEGHEGTAVVFIAQERANMDYGAATKPALSYAVKHAAKVIIKLTKTDIFQEAEEGLSGKEAGKKREVGHKILANVMKNNLDGRLGFAEYSVVNGVGLDDTAQLISAGEDPDFGYIVSDTRRGYYRFLLPSGDIVVKGKGNREALLLALPTAKNELRDLLKAGKPKVKPQPRDQYREVDPEALATPVNEEQPPVEGDRE